jgi:putative ABC transport system permease protein
MEAGAPESLREPNAVVINHTDRERLGVEKIGDTLEINQKQVRVVGFSRGALNFTTTPNVFVGARHMDKYSSPMLNSDFSVYATYFLVQAEPGTCLAALRERLRAELPDLEVLTTKEFSRQSQLYWMTTTGVGMLTSFSALLSLLVGATVIAQAFYSATVECLPQFAVLKALGAENRQVAAVLWRQGLWAALLGFPVGRAVSHAVSSAMADGSMPIIIPWWLTPAALLLITLVCVGAALLSAGKLRRLEPARVFRA